MQPAVRVFIGQAEHTDAAMEAAGLEYQIIQADIGDGDPAFDEGGIDAKRARLPVGQPSVEAAETAGGQGLPTQCRRSGLRQFLVEIPKVDRRDLFERVFLQRAAAVPDRLASAAAIFRALPDHPDAAAERDFVVWPPGLQHVEPVADLPSLDWGPSHRLDGQL